MKTLLVIVFILNNAHGDSMKMFDVSYAPSFEACRTEAFPYVRNKIAEIDEIKLDIMYCMELNEDEASSDEAAVNRAKKLYFLGTK